MGKEGSKTTVVWNPFVEKIATFKDMPLDGYKTMLCVEAANVGDNDTITVEPNCCHTLKTIIKYEKI